MRFSSCSRVRLQSHITLSHFAFCLQPTWWFWEPATQDGISSTLFWQPHPEMPMPTPRDIPRACQRSATSSRRITSDLSVRRKLSPMIHTRDNCAIFYAVEDILRFLICACMANHAPLSDALPYNVHDLSCLCQLTTTFFFDWSANSKARNNQVDLELLPLAMRMTTLQ